MPCAHSACDCAETNVKRGNRSFCSEECANPATALDECDCGHPGCKGVERREAGRASEPDEGSERL